MYIDILIKLDIVGEKIDCVLQFLQRKIPASLKPKAKQAFAWIIGCFLLLHVMAKPVVTLKGGELKLFGWILVHQITKFEFLDLFQFRGYRNVKSDNL